LIRSCFIIIVDDSDIIAVIIIDVDYYIFAVLNGTAPSKWNKVSNLNSSQEWRF